MLPPNIAAVERRTQVFLDGTSVNWMGMGSRKLAELGWQRAERELESGERQAPRELERPELAETIPGVTITGGKDEFFVKPLQTPDEFAKAIEVLREEWEE